MKELKNPRVLSEVTLFFFSFFLVDWSAHHQHSPCKTHTDEKYFQIKNHNNFTLVHKELISDENTNDPLSFYFLGKPT